MEGISFRIIQDMQEQDGSVWTGLIWLMRGSNVELLCKRYGTYGFREESKFIEWLSYFILSYITTGFIFSVATLSLNTDFPKRSAVRENQIL